MQELVLENQIKGYGLSFILRIPDGAIDPFRLPRSQHRLKDLPPFHQRGSPSSGRWLLKAPATSGSSRRGRDQTLQPFLIGERHPGSDRRDRLPWTREPPRFRVSPWLKLSGRNLLQTDRESGQNLFAVIRRTPNRSPQPQISSSTFWEKTPFNTSSR